MNNEYKGIVVEESLEDNRVINELEIEDIEITRAAKSEDRWHIYTVNVSSDDIDKLTKNIKPKWYMHFWKDRHVIAIFKDKRFEFDFDDKQSWEPVLEYGRSQGIPDEQLDFPIPDTE